FRNGWMWTARWWSMTASQPSVTPQLAFGTREQLVHGLLEHLAESTRIHRLALQPHRSLDHANQPLSLLPSLPLPKFLDVHFRRKLHLHTEHLGDGHHVGEAGVRVATGEDPNDGTDGHA